MKDEKSKITAVAIEKMIDFYQGNLRDIEHFLKVWAYAKTIGEQESVDENTQGILELQTDQRNALRNETETASKISGSV